VEEAVPWAKALDLGQLRGIELSGLALIDRKPCDFGAA
jgi:hypothetical protein